MCEVDDIPYPTRLGAIAKLIAKIKAAGTGKKLLVFDASYRKRSTAGNISWHLRQAGLNSMTRRVGDNIKVFVVT